MESDGEGAVTCLLRRVATGDAQAEEELYALLYTNLREQAGRLMARQPRGHTLQPTALVHEAYVRLVGSGGRWRDRTHFLALSARAMQHVLVDHARGRNRQKRGGGRARSPLDDALVAFEERAFDLVDLSEALDRLEAEDPESATVVRLRFFGGLGFPDVAQHLDLPLRTVERRWQYARTRLHEMLT